MEGIEVFGVAPERVRSTEPFSGRAVPTPFGRKLLAFEFVVLAEYWLAPLLFGLTNYAGLWSDIGTVLFFVLVGSLLAFVVVPLVPHLRSALSDRRRRLAFHAFWIGSFLLGLFLTNVLQFVDPSPGPAIVLGQSTVYSPLGAWPSLTVFVAPLQLWATFNVEAPSILFLLSFLSASSLVLGPLRARSDCPTPIPARGWRARLASLGILAPLGFITGCASCSPAYFALLALLAPGVAEGAYAAVPLVPWIGFAGLLYLFGFWLAVRLIGASTRSPSPVAFPAGA